MTRRALAALVCVGLIAGVAAFLFMHGPRAAGRSAARDDSSTRVDCAALWTHGFEVKGVVGTRHAQAYFDTRHAAGAPERVSGVVRFPDERTGEALADTLIGLQGPPPSDGCVVQLKEGDGDRDDGSWRVQIDSRAQVTGTRHTPDGHTEDIALAIVPETPCNTTSGWRTFMSAQWPVTFDYPTDWTVTEDVDSITIECASITHLATTRPSLIFERGRFPPGHAGTVAAARESFTEPYWFFKRAGDDWRVDAHADANSRNTRAHGSAAPRARRSERHRMTVLQGVAGEHRLYRPGVGSLGEGAGITRYLFIVGNEWVSLDASGENSHDADVGTQGGPVLFEGDLVGDRVVRSVSAR